MGRKKKILAGICVLCLLVLNVLIVCHRGSVGGNYELHLTMNSDKEQEIQVYYSAAGELSEKSSQVKTYDQVGESQELVFSVPFQFNMVRLDLGTQPGTFTIENVYLGCKDTKTEIPEMTNPKLIEGQQLESLEANDGTLKIWTNGTDPYVWLHLDKEELYPVLEKDYTQKLWIKNILMLLLIDGGAVVAFVFRKKVLTLPIELLQNRKLIMNLAKNDFKTKYAGSYLGIVWAFVQPIVTILVYWFVFSVGLKAGNVGAYDFMRSKIQSLEITPGQLGLEPCTGSLVATDPNTGEVLACVSYPGYDNNRLANTMDSDYYSKLLTNQSRPFYNNATQEKTAPGSTYKPLSAIAGLTEGVIDVNTYLPCAGVYKKVTPNPKCWIYPSSHGNLNVSQGIQHSCNDFFYEVGYRLGLNNAGDSKLDSDTSDGKSTQNYYSSERGIAKLQKYAEEFGLGDTSGMEIPESDPQISDDNSVLSAIGQGTNNYTTSQLARYITAVANEGTVYNLSLLDKVTSPKGKTIKDYTPEVKNKVTDVSASTWQAVHEGMRAVVTSEDKDIFTKLNSSGIALSGKTGTAQQSQTHPDHGLFVGFAPSDSPQIAFAIRIANGYSSTFAAEVGNDVMEYYYKVTPENELITGSASDIGTGSNGGD